MALMSLVRHTLMHQINDFMNEGFNMCHREIKKKKHHFSAFIALILKPRQLQEQRLPLLLWYLEIQKALVPSNYAWCEPTV